MTNYFKTSPKRAPNLTTFEFLRGTGEGGYNNGKWLPITMESGCL